MSAIVAILGALLWANADASELHVFGPDGHTLTWSQADFAARPHTTVTVNVEGKGVLFSGVPLSEILHQVGAPQGKELRGRGLCDIVLVSAADDYRVVLALAETDPMFRREAVLIADGADGAPLNDKSGPFRLVMEGEQRGARMVRMVSEIRVVQLPACAGID